jgi:hypothetical protein
LQEALLEASDVDLVRSIQLPNTRIAAVAHAGRWRIAGTIEATNAAPGRVDQQGPPLRFATHHSA